jgi:hypothetical protein
MWYGERTAYIFVLWAPYIWEDNINALKSRLGGAVISVIATEPKGHGFEPGQGDGFLRAIKIRSTPSFGWKVKPEVPCRKILRHVKNLLKSHGDG